MYNIGNIANNIVITWNGERGELLDFHGDYFIMHKNINSFCCTKKKKALKINQKELYMNC